MKRVITFVIVLASIMLVANCKKSQAPIQNIVSEVEVDIKVLTSGLTHPWELVWGPDNLIWMTERGGRVSRVDPSTGKVTVIANIDEVVSRDEGGLLGLAIHPEFSKKAGVFLVHNYVNNNGEYLEKVVKYTCNGSSLVNPVILLDNITANTFHNGSRLLISKDSKLLITTGEAGFTNLSQDLTSLNGKILRLNLDGSIPADNPFPGSPIWSFGHRNAQGLVFAGDILYSSEHGPNSDDEFNIIEKGKNYGWPAVKGFCNEDNELTFCTQQNVVEPLNAWTPTIAVSGIDYYNHDLIPQWKNSILMTTLKDKTLYQLKLNVSGNQVEEVTEIWRGTYGRLRDICVAPDGKVYISTSNGSDDQIIVIDKR